MRTTTGRICAIEEPEPDGEHTHICMRHDGHFGDHICQNCDYEWPKHPRLRAVTP